MWRSQVCKIYVIVSEKTDEFLPDVLVNNVLLRVVVICMCLNDPWLYCYIMIDVAYLFYGELILISDAEWSVSEIDMFTFFLSYSSFHVIDIMQDKQRTGLKEQRSAVENLVWKRGQLFSLITVITFYSLIFCDTI